jgi:predicted transcriptional regulator
MTICFRSHGFHKKASRPQKNENRIWLAEKCGITKTYISRIGHNANNVRFSILMRIMREGLGEQIETLQKIVNHGQI